MKRHPRLFFLVVFAALLAGGGMRVVSGFFASPPTASLGRPGYAQPMLMQEEPRLPGFDGETPSDSKSPPPEPHALRAVPAPRPPSAQVRPNPPDPERPHPSWRGFLPFPLPPPFPR